MERTAKRNARRRLVVLRPVNEKQLAAFLSSKGGQHEFVRRMAETLRQAWCRIEELQPEKRDEQEARDYAGYERVLVVSEADGTGEIFSEPWVSVKHVLVTPWTERDNAVWDAGPGWRELDEAPKSKALIVPQIRSELTDKALLELLKWEKRSELMQRLMESLRP